MLMSKTLFVQGINDKILSLDYDNCKIISVDAQASYKDGVLVLVTGRLTKENIVKTFTQTFFLAPQENGYYVLTDILRYVNNEVLSPAVTSDADVDATIDDNPITPDTSRFPNAMLLACISIFVLLINSPPYV